MEKKWVHLCVDMQRMFAEDTPWQVPWMRKVSAEIEELAGRHPTHTVFTRFTPPARANDMPGMWRDYYEKWWMMTTEHLAPEFVDIIHQTGPSYVGDPIGPLPTGAD